jgi:hypothetical protein
MSSNDGTAETYQRGYDLACELLEHIRLGRTTNLYSEAEIAEVEAERDRCKSLLDHEAASRNALPD